MAKDSGIKEVHLIKKIEQKDNYTFQIVWTDGLTSSHRLSDLQKECPCAFCVDEMTGKKLIDPRQVSENITAKRITNVGRYAIKIEFVSGCSSGIYTLNFLREQCKKN